MASYSRRRGAPVYLKLITALEAFNFLSTDKRGSFVENDSVQYYPDVNIWDLKRQIALAYYCEQATRLEIPNIAAGLFKTSLFVSWLESSAAARCHRKEITRESL